MSVVFTEYSVAVFCLDSNVTDFPVSPLIFHLRSTLLGVPSYNITNHQCHLPIAVFNSLATSTLSENRKDGVSFSAQQ